MERDNTPVIVGVGQFAERLDARDYRGLSAVQIAVEASRAAFADALSLKAHSGLEAHSRLEAHSGLEALAGKVGFIGTTRTFEDSAPQLAFPFGKSNNFPRSICRRLGIDPEFAVWEDAGGNTPQSLVSEACERIADGDYQAALLTGAEAISTARHLQRQGVEVDWSEEVEGQVEDRFGRAGPLLSAEAVNHGLMAAPPLYGLCENARRARAGLDREAYRLEMANWFAPLTRVAAANPYASMENREYSPLELATVTEKNRLIADPYPRLMVARDQVNQGAAVIVTSVSTARQLGIPQARWVYLHGYAQATERALEERADYGSYPAGAAAAAAALSAAGVSVDAIDVFDLYSCFPIAVSSVAESLGLKADDPRGLSATGGLPYFGGPGNNYSMHGIASVVERIRGRRDCYGFVGANGGFLSKYAAGIYSTRPAPFASCDSGPLQWELDAAPAPPFTRRAQGEGRVETYTVLYGRDGQPQHAVVIGRTSGEGTRFFACTEPGDSSTLKRMVADEPLGATVQVHPGSSEGGEGNRFSLA